MMNIKFDKPIHFGNSLCWWLVFLFAHSLITLKNYMHGSVMYKFLKMEEPIFCFDLDVAMV